MERVSGYEPLERGSTPLSCTTADSQKSAFLLFIGGSRYLSTTDISEIRIAKTKEEQSNGIC